MRRLSRFEQKILVAMGLVALAPLAGAIVLGRSAVRDAYHTGVNERIHAQLEGSVDLYQVHLETLREDAERTTDAIAYHHALHDALDAADRRAVDAHLGAMLERFPHVARVSVRQGEEVLAERAPDGMDGERRPVTLRRMLPAETLATPEGERERPETEVEVVATAPQAVFDRFQTAGEEAELYARLLEQSEFVSGTYVGVFLGLLGALIVVALGLGVLLSRRVTARVTSLARAVRRVGAGDLTVTVPLGGRDEVHELTEAFNAMVRDLRASRARIESLQRIGAWQEFARRLAHEIKNPLTPIQLAAQEMHRSYQGDDPRYQRKLEDACAIIEEEVATLRRLVGEFSGFAKLPRADLEAADLRDFLGDVERTVPAILEDVYEDEEAPAVEFLVADREMPVRIDAMMLKRCVDNLLRNALQALRGREGGHVRLRALREGEEVLLRIEDDGPGVAAKDRERLFDPYFTTKSDGTGLGLAIVKKVVLEHGGEITYADSELGGACFEVRLPLGGRPSARPPKKSET